jgi:hypothetical protein
MPPGSVKRRGASKCPCRSALGRSIADRVFSDFDHWIRGDAVRIKETLAVPTETSLKWHWHWLGDSTWRPYAANLEFRRRMFTDEQERVLANQI